MCSGLGDGYAIRVLGNYGDHSESVWCSIRSLFRDYANSLRDEYQMTLQYLGLDEELRSLPGKYSPASGGRLFVIEHRDVTGQETFVGCLALRQCNRSEYEMKKITLGDVSNLCGDFPGKVWTDTYSGHWRCELKRLYIRAECRGKGFAKALVLQSMAVARDMGYQVVCLDSNVCLKSALLLYGSLGFTYCSFYRSYKEDSTSAEEEPLEANDVVAMHRLIES